MFEYFLAWRGQKGSLRKKLRAATTYPEWKQAAREMDTYLGFDEWKQSEDDSYFDYNLVRRVRHTLARFRTNKDTRGLMDALAVCIRPNFAGTESVKMYSETFFGTKRIIEAHVNEVAESLDFVRRATDVSLEEKRAFFRAINNNYGSSALCLSGGASFGYYHFGVLKAFLDTDLLPRVITGTSAGGLIAALACTHTDAELKQLIRPELARKLCAFDDPPLVSLKRWWDTGARYSAYDWARKVGVAICSCVVCVANAPGHVLHPWFLDIQGGLRPHWPCAQRHRRSCRPPLAYNSPQPPDRPQLHHLVGHYCLGCRSWHLEPGRPHGKGP